MSSFSETTLRREWNIHDLKAPIGECRSGFEQTEGVEIKTATFTVSAVGAHVEGPDGSGGDGAFFGQVEMTSDFGGSCVQKRGRIRFLPMAMDTFAGDQPSH